jgi:hypothetical protein
LASFREAGKKMKKSAKRTLAREGERAARLGNRCVTGFCRWSIERISKGLKIGMA